MSVTTTSASISALLLTAALSLPAMAQSSQVPAPPPQASETQTAQPATKAQNPDDASTYATGEPLSTKSNEGFWGHLNPFARKKWVQRQVNPVKDRLNELDQLTSKNANDIKDVDARAQEGIHAAQTEADKASSQAMEAHTVATNAHNMAQQATSQTAELNTTVSNLDHYAPVSDVEIRFRNTQTRLNTRAKDALDQIAEALKGQKGYLVEVQGYSQLHGQAGIRRSKDMSDAVVRYLVVDHQIPVYKIYHVAMGNAPIDNEARSSTRVTVVHVTLMHNSLAALNTPASSSGGSPIGATQQPSMQPSPNPPGAASQPK